MTNRTLAQIKAYQYLSERGYDDELIETGINDSSDLTVDKVQQLINEYTDPSSDTSYLFDPDSQSKEHFDMGFDMGVAMAILGAV
jgi:hypothetical protein